VRTRGSTRTFTKLLEDLADEGLPDRLRDHAASLMAAAKEHRTARDELTKTHLDIANLRDAIEKREAAVAAREAALKKREAEIAVAEQQANDGLAALASQRSELAARRAEADARIRQAVLSEERLSKVRTEAAALAAQLGGLR
jgi:chromosome segregation ATPase